MATAPAAAPTTGPSSSGSSAPSTVTTSSSAAHAQRVLQRARQALQQQPQSEGEPRTLHVAAELADALERLIAQPGHATQQQQQQAGRKAPQQLAAVSAATAASDLANALDASPALKAILDEQKAMSVDELLAALSRAEDERDALRDQLSAVEQLFLQALTSADLQELNADTGLQCLQQLVEQWQQRKEDVAHLNAMLADSHGQIQAAQAQTLQLRQNLETIELHSMDVEAENRELVSRLEQAVSVSRRLDAALNEIKTYAKEVEQLHVDIQAERSKNRELQQQLEAATLAAASTSPALAGSCYFPTTAHGSHEDDTNPAAAAARWQARCSQLESELNLSRRDVARTEQMLHHEIGRLRQELEDSHRDMARVQQSQETQAELFRLRLDELQMELEARDAEVAAARADADTSREELNQAVDAIQSRLLLPDAGASPPPNAESGAAGAGAAVPATSVNMPSEADAGSLLRALDHWRTQRDARLQDAHVQLAQMQEQLAHSGAALALFQTPAASAETTTGGDAALGSMAAKEQLMETLQEGQAQRAAAAAKQATKAEKSLDAARRELAAVRSSRNRVIESVAQTLERNKNAALQEAAHKLQEAQANVQQWRLAAAEMATALSQLAAASGEAVEQVKLGPAEQALDVAKPSMVVARVRAKLKSPAASAGGSRRHAAVQTSEAGEQPRVAPETPTRSPRKPQRRPQQPPPTSSSTPPPPPRSDSESPTTPPRDQSASKTIKQLRQQLAAAEEKAGANAAALKSVLDVLVAGAPVEPQKQTASGPQVVELSRRCAERATQLAAQLQALQRRRIAAAGIVAGCVLLSWRSPFFALSAFVVVVLDLCSATVANAGLDNLWESLWQFGKKVMAVVT